MLSSIAGEYVTASKNFFGDFCLRWHRIPSSLAVCILRGGGPELHINRDMRTSEILPAAHIPAFVWGDEEMSNDGVDVARILVEVVRMYTCDVLRNGHGGCEILWRRFSNGSDDRSSVINAAQQKLLIGRDHVGSPPLIKPTEDFHLVTPEGYQALHVVVLRISKSVFRALYEDGNIRTITSRLTS